jgi:hypothetical protein
VSTEPHKSHPRADGTLVVNDPSLGQFLGNPPLCVAPIELTCTRTPLAGARVALPDEFVIGSLGHPDTVRLRAPLTVRIRKDEDDFVVWHNVLQGEGRGPSLGVAVDRFRSGLSQRYLTLRAEAASLGADAAHELELLQQYLEDRP